MMKCMSLSCNSKLEIKQATEMHGYFATFHETYQLLISCLPSAEEMTASLSKQFVLFCARGKIWGFQESKTISFFFTALFFLP